jgi:hypothetical protein
LYEKPQRRTENQLQTWAEVSRQLELEFGSVLWILGMVLRVARASGDGHNELNGIESIAIEAIVDTILRVV